MSDITLEWFFQIPGLFITIGVLLILIALLVLIIGSNKAKNNKQEDLALVDDVQESAVNQVESVNILEPNGVNYLNGTNSLNSLNNINPVNNLNNSLENNGLVNNNSGVAAPMMTKESVSSIGDNNNIAPMVNTPASIITPVNVNDNIVEPQVVVNEEKVEPSNVNSNLATIETVVPSMAQPIGTENDMPNENLNIQEPVLETIEVGINEIPVVSPNEPTTLVQNTNDEIKNEATMAPIFGEPITPIENVVVPQVQEEVKNNETINEALNNESVINVENNVNEMVPPLVEPVVSNSNTFGTDFNEPIEPVKQQAPIMDNVINVPTVGVNVNDTINPTPTIENGEVEEIL